MRNVCQNLHKVRKICRKWSGKNAVKGKKSWKSQEKMKAILCGNPEQCFQVSLLCPSILQKNFLIPSTVIDIFSLNIEENRPLTGTESSCCKIHKVLNCLCHTWKMFYKQINTFWKNLYFMTLTYFDFGKH